MAGKAKTANSAHFPSKTVKDPFMRTMALGIGGEIFLIGGILSINNTVRPFVDRLRMKTRTSPNFLWVISLLLLLKGAGPVLGQQQDSTTPAPPVVIIQIHTLESIFDGTSYDNYTSEAKTAILRKAQQKLKDAGHYRGAVDGKAGGDTCSAIRDWQSGHGLTASGAFNLKTLISLSLNFEQDQKPLAPSRSTAVAQSRSTGTTRPRSSSTGGGAARTNQLREELVMLQEQLMQVQMLTRQTGDPDGMNASYMRSIQGQINSVRRQLGN